MSANGMETKYIKNQVVEEERCSFTTNHGNRCRNAHLGNASGLCAVHEDVPKSRDKKEIEAETQLVAEFLLEKNVGLCTKDDVNRFTSQLLTLVTQKKVSRQDGSLLAYIASVLLQTIAPAKSEAVEERREEFVENVAAPNLERVMYPAHNAGPIAEERPMPPMPRRKYQPGMNPGRWR